MSKSSPAVSQLFTSAVQNGNVSQLAAQALNIPDLGAQIQEGLGVAPDDVRAQEVTLVTTLVDDSGSIRFAGNSQLVRDGHNGMVAALKGSKQAGGVLMHTRYLNGTVLYPYSLLDQVPQMDSHNYDPNGGTPLYDQTALILGTVLAKYQEMEEAGTAARSVTVIVTDGMDEGSRVHTADSVRKVVNDMLARERHIIGAIGIQYTDSRTGQAFDFREVFREMGLQDRWILTPENDHSAIRRAFNFMSQSAVRASQGGAQFSKTAAGGFVTP
ncbi:MAG: hypothetical protein IT406_00720 [Candidatus Yanofskybacteria bacterium]|nr:hypothetical protein [Candidatus Yanofskybacteria bacterium]